jgi:hypothetical protein
MNCLNSRKICLKMRNLKKNLKIERINLKLTIFQDCTEHIYIDRQTCLVYNLEKLNIVLIFVLMLMNI